MAKEWENQSYCHLVLAKAKNLTIWQHDHIFRMNVPINIFTCGISKWNHCAAIMQKNPANISFYPAYYHFLLCVSVGTAKYTIAPHGRIIAELIGVLIFGQKWKKNTKLWMPCRDFPPGFRYTRVIDSFAQGWQLSLWVNLGAISIQGIMCRVKATQVIWLVLNAHHYICAAIMPHICVFLSWWCNLSWK